MVLCKRSSSKLARPRHVKLSPTRYLEPLLLLFGKHTFFHHAGLNRHTGKAFKTEPDIAAKLALGLHSSHQDVVNGGDVGS